MRSLNFNIRFTIRLGVEIAIYLLLIPSENQTISFSFTLKSVNLACFSSSILLDTAHLFNRLVLIIITVLDVFFSLLVVLTQSR